VIVPRPRKSPKRCSSRSGRTRHASTRAKAAPHRGSGGSPTAAVDRVRHAQSVRAHDDRYAQLHFQRDADTVADVALRHSDFTALHEALGHLTSLQRQAMLLIYFAGHTHLQASHLLGIPLGTFKSRILAGLVALRRVHPGYDSSLTATLRAGSSRSNRGEPDQPPKRLGPHLES